MFLCFGMHSKWNIIPQNYLPQPRRNGLGCTRKINFKSNFPRLHFAPVEAERGKNPGIFLANNCVRDDYSSVLPFGIFFREPEIMENGTAPGGFKTLYMGVMCGKSFRMT